MLFRSDLLEFLQNNSDILPAIFITSQVEIKAGANKELEVEVGAAEGEKCERCWTYSETVGLDHDHPTLCKRCSAVL